MAAEVNTIYRHQAVCLDCGWWGDEVESADAAEQDVLDHDEEHHGMSSPPGATNGE